MDKTRYLAIFRLNVNMQYKLALYMNSVKLLISSWYHTRWILIQCKCAMSVIFKAKSPPQITYLTSANMEAREFF